MKLNIFKYVRDEIYYDEKECHLGFVQEEDIESILVYFYFKMDSGGQDTSVLKYLFNYLSIIANSGFPKEYTGEWYSIMDIFQSNNLINSGVSIRVPWLTDRGKHAHSDIGKILSVKDYKFCVICSKKIDSTIDGPTICKTCSNDLPIMNYND